MGWMIYLYCEGQGSQDHVFHDINGGLSKDHSDWHMDSFFVTAHKMRNLCLDSVGSRKHPSHTCNTLMMLPVVCAVYLK